MLLVVLAFANPFVRRAAADANGRLLLIVLDNSFSMRAGTRFADAKQQALATLAAKPHAQKAQIIALGGQVEVLTQPITDDAQLRAALESIQPGDGHANFGELGRAIRAMSETVRMPHRSSPLQRHAAHPRCRPTLPTWSFPATSSLMLHPVAQGAAPPNWTVESVNAPAELADPKDPKRSRVEAVVAGFNTPAATKTVSLVVNGKVMATEKVNVPANGRATVEFAPLNVGYGFNRCQVRIEGGDALPGRRCKRLCRAPLRSRARALCPCRLATRDRRFTSARRWTRRRTHPLFCNPSPRSSPPISIPSKFAFVVLSDTVALPSIFEHALAQYVAKGGNVLIALGTSAAHHARIPLWGGRRRTRTTMRAAAMRPPSARSTSAIPALEQAQPGRDNGGWAEVKVFYAVAVDPAQARVAARLTDGTPLLLDKQIGEGHILLLTSGLDNLTNDLPLHPVFVAFVDRTARYLSGSERLSGSRLVDSYRATACGVLSPLAPRAASK